MQLPSLSCLLTGVILFFFTSSVFSQSTPVAQLVQSQFDGKNETATAQPFTILHERNQKALEIAPLAQFLTLDHTILGTICQNRPQNLIIKLPYHGETIEMLLVRKAITSDDFSIITERSNTPVGYLPGVHYRGIVAGDAQSVVAISFFEDEVMGGINTTDYGDLVLGRIAERDNQHHYILYADHEMTVKNPSNCGTIEEEHTIGKQSTNAPGSTEVDKCVRVFIEADNELFLDKSSSVQSTVNYLLGMFNQTATLYANEQINTVVSQLFVWTTPDIYTPTSSATVLNQFKTFRTSFNGDLAHLVGLGGNNLGGIAYVDVLCSTYNYAFSDIHTTYSNVPTYSWTVEVFTHEMGHNLGSRHTQWCGWQGGPIDNCVPAEGSCNPGPAPANGGTIMSYCHLTNYGINFNLGFGPQPGNTVRTETTAASCLGASCPVANCDAPIALTITNITGNGATIGWGATNGATGYVLRYRSVGGAQWTTINNPSNPYQITGLPSNDEVEVAVQSLCGSNASDYKNGILFITGASGGSGGGGTTCDVPSNVQAIPNTTSAQVSWNTVSGATAYSIQWKVSTSSTWSNAVNVSAATYNITGLSTATTYNVRIAAQCSSGTSAFATSTFTTTGGGGGSTCNAPTGLTAQPTATGAQTAWTAVSGATGYVVQWKTTISAVWSNPVSTTTAAYAVTGLSANTAYDLRIATTCGSSTSAYTSTTFTTIAQGCSASPILTAVPTQTTANISWNTVSGVSTYRLEWKLASASTWNNTVDISTNSYTISNLSASTAYHLRVSSVCTNGVSTPNTSLFSTASVTASCGAPSNFVSQASTNSSATSWSAVQGAIYYRIQWKLTTSTSWNPLVSTVSPNYHIQNLVSGTAYHVRVTSLCSAGTSAYTTSTFTTASNNSSCGTPSNLSATAAATSANTNWSAVNGANAYNIQWKLVNSSTWNTGVNSSTANYSITGLSSSTAYNVRVAAICNGVSSAYITTSFTTTSSASCGAPASLSVTPSVNSGQALWSSVSGANDYQIQWKLSSSSVWGSLVTVTTNQFNITGLQSASTYDVRVRSVCSGIASSFTSSAFSTSSSGGGGSCAVPGSFTASNLQPTSVVVNWGSVSGAASYTLRIRVQGSSSWFAFTGLPSPGVTVQNMTPSTTYEFQVMTNCGSNGSSAWTSVLTVTTPALFTDPSGLVEERNNIVKLPTTNTGLTTSAAPNPFLHSTQLVLGTTEDLIAQITIMDSFGRVVSDRQTMIMGGTADLEAQTLNTGVYFVRVRVNSEVQTIRIVKQ